VQDLSLLTKLVRRFSAPSAAVAVKPQRASGEFPTNSPSPEFSSASAVTFSDGWDARPRYQSDEDDDGIFVGRKEILDRLTSDFTSRRSGTILISGVRGVGKTALVEKALVDARQKLAHRYWKKAAPLVNETKWWHPAKSRAREVLYGAGRRLGKSPEEYLTMKEAAAQLYTRRSVRWFWRRWNPVTRHLRRMHEASRSQLLVLKFNASDIGGAMADPGEVATAGKPNVNPEKLLRALIRKIHSVVHQSWESYILNWSLSRKQRNRFLATLQAAYDKSVSKSYTETISNKVSEAIKRSQVTTSALKLNAERIAGLAVCLGLGGLGTWLGVRFLHWSLVTSYIAGGAATLATFFALTVTIKRSWESSQSRNRDAQFSYEYDYSLARMEYDIEDILSVLRQPKHHPFNPLRCFTRKIIIFDELDKLENPIQQLNDVITHFKNFFTLSDALFVFLTDHEFYEHLSIEGTKAQQRRHYSPEHTFFTQKVYLRKPEFDHFKQTVFRFCNTKELLARIEGGPLDVDLLNFLVSKEPSAFNDPKRWQSLENLTHLYVHRDAYMGVDNSLLETAFLLSGGKSDPVALAEVLVADLISPRLDPAGRTEMEQQLILKAQSNPLAVAHVWAASAAAGKDSTAWRVAFKAADGWKNFEAVSYLYKKIWNFAGTDVKLINGYYDLLRRRRDVKKYASVDGVPFTLTDLAQAICFQTRNHYFDLYYLIYDYVGSYFDGLPVLHLEGERFTREHRLWSRYQQMISLAFYYKREDHPSREYFNALLMESLYSVFDTRGWGGAVKVEDILFSPEKIAASLQQPTPVAKTNGSGKRSNQKPKPGPEPIEVTTTGESEKKSLTNGRIASTITVRDAEQINQSLLRLLRIAVARRAVRVGPNFTTRLNDSNVRLKDLSELTFEWEPDCDPVITQEGLDLEEYEKELIQLWDDNKNEVEALEHELENMWRFVEVPAASGVRKTRGLFAELRTTVEGLRRRSKTISSHDATKLRADLRPPDDWISTVADLIAERFVADPHTGTWDLAMIKDKSNQSALPSSWRSRIEEFENKIGIPPRCVWNPLTTDTLVYFVIGSIPPEIDASALEQTLPKNDTYVFWYAPHASAEQATPNADNTTLRFYFSPPADQTISHFMLGYGALAAKARVKVFEGLAMNGGYRTNSGLLAGLELIAPMSGLGELIGLLSLPDLKIALDTVDQLPGRFKSNPTEFWSTYGVDMNAWSPDDAAKKIAADIVSKFKWPSSSYLQIPLEIMLRQGLRKDAAKVLTSPVLNASEPHGNARLLLKEVVDGLLQSWLQAAKVSDQKFAEQLRKETEGWLVNTLDAVAKARNLSLTDLLASLPTLAGELEKARSAAALNLLS